MAALGIDLGTTNSCVGVFRHGKVEIIANDHGNRTTPSVVAFLENSRLIGESAREQIARNPANTLSSVKRLIGRDSNEPCVQEDMKLWPFKVNQHGNKPTIQVQYQKRSKNFFPDEISAMVLTKMKETAAAYLGKNINKAVITVPAYFNDAQRKATQDAGTIAGLDVLRIINEPTSAALAYDFLSKDEKEHNVLVFDFGGGTFDVSVLNIDDGIVEVLATNGDTHLGGDDFDNKLVEHFIGQFEQTYRKDISNNKRAVQRLKNACEEAKKTLSVKTEARIEIESLVDQIDFHTSITRARFEHLCSDIFQKLRQPVENVLSDSKLSKSEIDQIVLVGGSTNIPKVQRDLQTMFHGKSLNKSINPDEAVAFGAAIQAAVISGDRSAEIVNTVLLDVTPLSLGICVTGGVMATVVKRNTSIPLKKEKEFSNAEDNHTAIGIRIYEGERPSVEDNKLLDKFSISGIPPAPRGQSKITVTFEIDTNGTLTVSAKDKSAAGNKNSVTISGNQGHRSKMEIERMISDAERYRAQDIAWKERADARQDLDWYVYKLERKLRNPGLNGRVEESYRQDVIGWCQQVSSWLKLNTDADKHQYESTKIQLETSCRQILDVYANCGLREVEWQRGEAPQSMASERDYTAFVERFNTIGSFVNDLD